MPPSATHAPHPLTALRATPKNQTTLEFQGRLFHVKHLKSRAIDEPESPDKKSLSEKERKDLLSQKQKNTLNLAKRLQTLDPEKRTRVLTERVVARKKLELRKELGIGKVGHQLKKLHPETFMATEAEVEQEAEDVLEFKRRFDAGN